MKGWERNHHELFDEAQKRFNEKQTRSDRCIDDYYEKIRSGKQEKPFHELILQIGNCDDTAVGTETADKATEALREYYSGFQERNPHLRVFSAHLHLDEHAFKGIKIAVGILILDAAVTMIKKMHKKKMPRAIMLCSCVVMLFINIFAWNFSSISLMLIAAAVSLTIFILNGAPEQKGGAGK